MDPIRFLKCGDPFERGLMQAIAAAARTLDRERDRERANLNAAELMKMLQHALQKK